MKQLAFLALAIHSTLAFAETTDPLADGLTPFLKAFAGRLDQFDFSGQVETPIDGRPQSISFRLLRYGKDSFDLDVTHQDYAIRLLRRDAATAFILPKHQTVFVGHGKVDESDHLTPDGIIQRLLSNRTTVAMYLPLLQNGNPAGVSALLRSLAKVKYEAESKQWRGGSVKFQFPSRGKLVVDAKGTDVKLSITEDVEVPDDIGDFKNLRVVKLERAELERQLTRGVRRAFEILAPSPVLTNPRDEVRKTSHGKMRWIDGQRVVMLQGTPEQIGTAHGLLLRQEAQACIDSVLYSFGTVHTIRTGRWFRHDLQAAHKRLAPHIPERHQIETRAMATALEMEPSLAEILNVFPELFHCSGFALFGKATKDGKLYHGRVLDYMTTIGLQDSATTFVVHVDGKIPFVNVGYAGFIGSVSGMNARAISLGEMGGRGEGKWDGVPMATLMRRTLEECETLEEVKDLWRKSPRTCEYYYVFADGKTNQAVGVAATPASLEFVKPGQGHPLLGDGIDDAVVLSAGSRLETLRARVKQRYGQFDAKLGQWLMSRPVAMESNLHNVLFVPEDGDLYVANATHKKPAAERPYTKLNLYALLESMKPLRQADATPLEVPPSTWAEKISLSSPKVFAKWLKLANSVEPLEDAAAVGRLERKARDTLNPAEDDSADARECLKGLIWKPEDFQVSVEWKASEHGDAIVRFPSPIKSDSPQNDTVSMEWYVARDGAKAKTARSVVVLHESGSNMQVGRLMARGFRENGLHAFLLHLPHYGLRRSGAKRPANADIVTLMRQAIADARRARDAVATLPFVDSSHVSLQGTSLGGFVCATSASLDNAYDSVFVMLAGGNLYDLIQRGKKDTAKVREQLEKAGITDEKLQQMTQIIEPTRITHRLSPKKTWLFSGEYDQVVPIDNALALAKSARLPLEHHVRMATDHYSGFLYLPIILDEMAARITGN